MATHRRIAYIALCGLGCFADAMTTRLDRMMQITRKPSNKQRVCADSTVSVQDVQACITRHLRDRSTTDLWSCIVPGPDGPRTWSFKSRPDGRWMARFSSLAFDLVCDVCKNTKILSRVLIAALQVCSGATLEDGDTHILTAHSWLCFFFLNNYGTDNLT